MSECDDAKKHISSNPNSWQNAGRLKFSIYISVRYVYIVCEKTHSIWWIYHIYARSGSHTVAILNLLARATVCVLDESMPWNECKDQSRGTEHKPVATHFLSIEHHWVNGNKVADLTLQCFFLIKIHLSYSVHLTIWNQKYSTDWIIQMFFQHGSFPLLG